MEINVHIHHHESTELVSLVREVLHLLKGPIMSALSNLQAAVAAESTVIDSAVTLLQGLKAALDAAGTDPVALQALSDDITAKTTALATAITTNTPAA